MKKTDARHAEFNIDLLENNNLRISTNGCEITTEYIEDEKKTRTKMSPADLFFSAFALCASMDVLAFCRSRDIPTDGLSIRQVVDWNRRLTDQSVVKLHIELPDHFPPKYEKAIGRAVDYCLVAKLGQGLTPSSFERFVTRRQPK